MVNFRNIILAVLILAAGFSGFFFLVKSDSARIRNRVEHLAHLASKEGSENELTAGITARRIGRIFASSCRIDLPVYNISRDYSPRDMVSRTMYLRSQYKVIALDIYDFHVAEFSNSRATVYFTVIIDTEPNAGGNLTDIHELKCQMTKNDDDDWCFESIESVTVLEK